MKTSILLSIFCSIIFPHQLKTAKTGSESIYVHKKLNCLTYNAHYKQEIPSKTFNFDQMNAGDCVLAGSTVTIWADGNIKFSGTVWTNHTHSGDQWHHIITFKDYRGLTLFSIRFEGPSHMNDDGTRYAFGPLWQKFDPKFFEQVEQASASGSC